MPRGLSALRSLLVGRGNSFSPGDELPKGKGTYILVFRLNRDVKAKMKYGFTVLKPGVYAYVGSAFGPGGLRKRIERHLREEKRKHWHIDWITTTEAFEPLEIIVFQEKRIESAIAELLERKFEGVAGFGASDTKDKTHLFRIA